MDSCNPPSQVISPRLRADDHGFDEADARQFGSDDAMTSVFDVVAATHARAKDNANGHAAELHGLAHLLDLSAVAIEQLLPGGVGNEDIIECDENGVVDARLVVEARALVGLAHGASVSVGSRCK